MNKIFISPLGSEYDVDARYQGRYIKSLIGREYSGDKENIYCDKYNEIMEKHKDKVYFKGELVCDKKTLKTMDSTGIYMILEAKDWKEYETIKEYNPDRTMNTEYKMKVEVVLMDEEYSRRLFFDYSGEGRHKTDLADILYNLDSLFYDLQENKEKYYVKECESADYISLEFYSNNGEYVDIEMNESEFKSKVVSVRIVEFKEDIVY